MVVSERITQLFEYTTITGFFLQDEPGTNPSTFAFVSQPPALSIRPARTNSRQTATNFGLINRSYDTDGEYDPDRTKTQWQRFERRVNRLNNDCTERAQYKVLYLGRHGEGVHNVAENYYGTPAWDSYWSKLDGNDTMTWADAQLTSLGIAQAQEVHAFWDHEIATQNIPLPQTYYTSPLTRCLSTANLTFSGLPLPKDRTFIPTVKELLREVIGEHTCDRRSIKTYIHEYAPTYIFEKGFAENDELWRPDVRETDSAIDARMKKLLDDVFAHDKDTFISFTSHSGAIAAMLRVIGHRPFRLLTGAVIPVLVRSERVRDV